MQGLSWAPAQLSLFPWREPWEWEAASSWPGAQGGPGGRALGRVHFLAPLFATCPCLLVAVSAPPTASLAEWAAGLGLEFSHHPLFWLSFNWALPWEPNGPDENPALPSPQPYLRTLGVSLCQCMPLFPLLEKELMGVTSHACHEK